MVDTGPVEPWVTGEYDTRQGIAIRPVGRTRQGGPVAYQVTDRRRVPTSGWVSAKAGTKMGDRLANGEIVTDVHHAAPYGSVLVRTVDPVGQEHLRLEGDPHLAIAWNAYGDARNHTRDVYPMVPPWCDHFLMSESSFQALTTPESLSDRRWLDQQWNVTEYSGPALVRAPWSPSPGRRPGFLPAVGRVARGYYRINLEIFTALARGLDRLGSADPVPWSLALAVPVAAITFWILSHVH